MDIKVSISPMLENVDVSMPLDELGELADLTGLMAQQASDKQLQVTHFIASIGIMKNVQDACREKFNPSP